MAATDWWVAHIQPCWDAFVEQMKPDRILKIFVNQKVISSSSVQDVKTGETVEKRNEHLLLALRGKDHHIMSLFRRALAETKQMRLSQYLEFSKFGNNMADLSPFLDSLSFFNGASSPPPPPLLLLSCSLILCNCSVCECFFFLR